MIERIQTGDGKAFDTLVTEYRQRVVNLSFAMLSDYEEACDAAQETFVKVYRNISGFRGDSSLSTWIYRIAKNVCNDFLRKRKERTVSIDDEEAKTDLSDESYSPEKSAEKKELSRLVRDAISRLDENSREVLVLYEFEHMSYDEIAELLKLPPGTVKSRISRTREKLKNILSPYRELFL